MARFEIVRARRAGKNLPCSIHIGDATMFADHARIIIKSGKGGDGHVSFRREKYVPNGGPDGGDGGDGGNIVFEIDDGMNTLADFRYKRRFEAQSGENGQKRNCHGKNGEDLVLRVPAGTIVRDAETEKVIADMSAGCRRKIVLHGGRGGFGNQHFATSRMQAPKYARPGQDALELEVTLELKVIADAGLVGFPNVGKSTLLSHVTNARPKIANYHFTTLRPNLGVVDFENGEGFIIADIPGLIEGASDGLGLGHEFLRHIERTKVIIHIVDAASVEGRDPVEDIRIINKELGAYNPELLKKPQLIAANKIDILYGGESEIIRQLKASFEPEGIAVYPISAVSGQGLKELLYAVKKLLDGLPNEPVVYEPEYIPAVDIFRQDSYTVSLDPQDGAYVIEGPKIEKMLGYTNLDTERGFLFFQKFLKEEGILKELEDKGIQEGDTVRIYSLAFDYYK